jgi:CxxC-x17-CxxC domain-containing protein
MSQRTVYEVKCTTCNQTATVPFKPTPGKPVYCRACFAKQSTNQPLKTSGPHANFEPKQAWARRR